MHLDRRKAVMILSGMGKVRAMEACHRLLSDHPGLRHLLLVGYAGGLSGLKVGDRIEPDVFVEYDFDARPFEPFPHLVRSRSPILLHGSKRAALITQDRFLTDNPFRGTQMARKYPRMACDMEAYAAAYFSKMNAIPLTVLKYISDEADPSAEHDFIKACKELSGPLMESVRQAVEILDQAPARRKR